MSYLGAVVGAAIDRSDGDSGIKGAIFGTFAAKTAATLTPLIVTFLIGWVVQKAIISGWNAIQENGND